MKPLPFTGVPKLRPAALPTRRAVFIGGRLRRPRTGLDMLLFGVAAGTALNGRSQRFASASDSTFASSPTKQETQPTPAVHLL